ncbi:molybdenum cofactor guanylyltransferase [Oceanobacillus bengalensis]|uniref:Probable molybdenum cofactor guanylyltransferase n=1 Tax=Oceanobacillus bengalensis TaxID=1435466 RepID=A0A494Z5H3_9BACI|nr:molybdenum cofactor guanylyltransferase [Oceanobacillus bengalensis]RKQ17566.1 molybdenum cofactor guanylyltransferase [Oceanobacillus bengalensis]
MGKRYVGVVLAGGQSRRFGTAKAIAKKNNKAFYKYSIDALAPIVDCLLVVTNSNLEHIFDKEKTKIIHDTKKYQGQGPLAGIFTAMEKYPAEWYIAVPIDVPFVETWVYEHLISQIEHGVDAIIPIVAGKRQPLIAIYHSSTRNLIEKGLNKGERSVQKLLEKCTIKYVPFDEEGPFININDVIDYQQYIEG